MKDSKVVIDLHRHFLEPSELNEANLSPNDFLKLHLAIAEINNYEIHTMCGSHNSTTWAKEVWDKYKKFPKEVKDRLHLYPQAEYNVSVSNVLEYEDPRRGDSKYVFKKMHMLAAAKKGKEEEFFKKTKIYSVWSDMYIKKDLNHELVYRNDLPISRSADDKFFSLGILLKSARNILCDKYCKDVKDRIPFDIYENTIEMGLTYTQIRDRFIDDSFNYLVSKGLIKNTKEAKERIDADVSSHVMGDGISYHFLKRFNIEDQIESNEHYNPYVNYPSSGEHSLSRLKLEDVKLLFGDTAEFCVAHPKTIAIHTNTGLPISAFDGVDISNLSKPIKKSIQDLLKIYRQTGVDTLILPNDSTNILKMNNSTLKVAIKGDSNGFVRNQIFIKNLDKYTKQLGFIIKGVEVCPKMFEDRKKVDGGIKTRYDWQLVDVFMRLGKAVNLNSSSGDWHMKSDIDTAFIDENVESNPNHSNYADELTYACTKCGWLDLLNGKFDRTTQQVEVRPLNRAVDTFSKTTGTKKSTEKEESL